VQDICRKVGDLRTTLDEIEKQVLQGAAAAKLKLQDQILICIRVNDEIMHMQDVVTELKAQAGLE
jgi:hypothetical protein